MPLTPLIDYHGLQIIKEAVQSHPEEPNGDVMTLVPSQIAVLLVQIHCTRRIDAAVVSADTLTSMMEEFQCFFNRIQHTFVIGFNSDERSNRFGLHPPTGEFIAEKFHYIDVVWRSDPHPNGGSNGSVGDVLPRAMRRFAIASAIGTTHLGVFVEIPLDQRASRDTRPRYGARVWYGVHRASGADDCLHQRQRNGADFGENTVSSRGRNYHRSIWSALGKRLRPFLVNIHSI